MFKKFRVVLLLAALSTTLCLMSNTYSRYVADTTGNIDAVFSKWQILVKDEDITNATNSSVTFTPHIEANNNVKTNTIAPSSKGYFDIDIDPTNVEVSFRYTIGLTMQSEIIPDLMITKYSIVPASYVEGTILPTNNIENGIITSDMLFDNNTQNFAFEPFTIRIYFEWIEGVNNVEGANETMNDEADTAIGSSIEKVAFDMNATINFEQII